MLNLPKAMKMFICITIWNFYDAWDSEKQIIPKNKQQQLNKQRGSWKL